MRTPPLLLGAALLFWGWQTGFLVAGAVMAVVIESARFTKPRWEFTDEDFSRVWTLCTLLFLAATVYAFTANEGPLSLRGLFQAPNLSNLRTADITSTRAAALMIRWLPMVFFLFVAAQAFSSREEISLETISLIFRRRRKKGRRLNQPVPVTRRVNVSYPYFAACLFAASIHTRTDATFFCGLCTLLVWALWAQRSRRFGMFLWGLSLAAAILLGYVGQRGFGPLLGVIQNYNPQWASRFARRGSDPRQSKTALGRIGRLKDSGLIVIRLETRYGSAAPAFLREASYRAYASEAWYAGSSKNDFENVLELPPNSGIWPLLPEKTNTADVRIACHLEGGRGSSRVGLLPLPGGSGRLEDLPAFVLQKNSAGAVLAEGPGLVVFDARYGPDATIDSAPDPSEDLDVPAPEIAALDQVISELHLAGPDTEQALGTIDGFFQSKFSYSTWQRPDRSGGTNETPLGRFLLRSRSGHCEYFATATVLLLRRIGVPARYAVGYCVHEGTGRKYVVRLRDAHAWCLVWRDGQWQDFDTTPASWIEAEARRASPLQWLSDLWSRIGFEFAKFRWGQSRLRQYFLWALVPVLALLFYQVIFRRRTRRRRKEPAKPGTEIVRTGLDSEFYQLERKLVERGVVRQMSEPLSSWLRRAIAEPALAGAGDTLNDLLRLHYRYRFDPLGLNEPDREQLRREAQACLLNLTGRNQGAARAA